jgi:hypothetical protein
MGAVEATLAEAWCLVSMQDGRFWFSKHLRQSRKELREVEKLKQAEQPAQLHTLVPEFRLGNTY